MHALLGKIIEVVSDGSHHKVTFEPLCTLPDHKAPPAHLKDQKLSIERETPDPREIGERGDSIALTVKESLVFLRPLTLLEPEHSTSEGHLLLRWWKDDTPPEWTVRAGYKILSGAWTRSQGSTHWQAALGADDLKELPRPSELEICCGDLKIHHTLTPAPPFAAKVCKRWGQVHRMESHWLSVDVTPKSGGALASLASGENTANYFFSNPRLIQHPLDRGGHVDRFRTGWGEWNTMRDKTLDSTGATRESGASRVTMQGNLEDDLRTALSATLLDDWPLLLMRRDFFLHAKKDDKKDELRQPVDEMRLFQTGFRCAVNPQPQSRVWCCENGEAISFRLAREHEGEMFWHWTLEDGWVLLSRTASEHLLYFFDAQSALHLGLWRGPHVMTLEPFWSGVPLKIGESTGFSLGLAAGEVGGATSNGAWIASRTVQSGEAHGALLGRFKTAPHEVVFSLGERTVTAPLSALLLPGIGTLHGASARLPESAPGAKFEVRLVEKEVYGSV